MLASWRTVTLRTEYPVIFVHLINSINLVAIIGIGRITYDFVGDHSRETKFYRLVLRVSAEGRMEQYNYFNRNYSYD